MNIDNCNRCQGLLIKDSIIEDGQCPIPILICKNCGNVVENIITKNRDKQLKEKK